MPDTDEAWDAARMYELGTRHARVEAERNIDELMATLVAEPVYQFFPAMKSLRGGEKVRRYYLQFFDDFMNKIVDYELIDEWANESSVVQEYSITLEVDGVRETHRTVGVLYTRGHLLGGERIYASRRLVQLMAGEMYAELEDLAE